MLSPSQVAQFAIAGGDPVEVARAVRQSQIGLRGDSPITFSPADGTPLMRAWSAWVGGRFRPALAPHILCAMGMAGRGEFRELADLDSSLSDALGPLAHSGSRAAGLRVLDASAGALHMGEVSRLAAFAVEGSAPGHFATAFAARAAAFNIGFLPTLVAYLHAEWSAAAGLPPWSEFSPYCDVAIPAIHHCMNEYARQAPSLVASA